MHDRLLPKGLWSCDLFEFWKMTISEMVQNRGTVAIEVYRKLHVAY